MSRASATFRKVGPELEEFPVTTVINTVMGAVKIRFMVYEG